MFIIMSTVDQTFKALKRQNLTCSIMCSAMEDRMLIQSVAEVYVSIMQVLNSFPGQCLRGQIYMQLSPKS